ncbi:MAG: preprotein translocase subunit YajC [Verrucomicrobiota bacterium JB022]|nr:preprotein translocase subunit YajC [Verrucomicrobiota bacterium JB022]
MTHLIWLAQETAPEGANAPSPMIMILGFIFLFLAMNLLIGGPQRKRQKQMQQMQQDLKAGDKVITTGGICGVVTNVRKDRVQIKTSGATFIDVLRTSIQGLDEPEKKPEDKKADAKKAEAKK